MKRYMRGGLAALVVTIAACDVPTGLPGWDTSWLVPGETTTIGVSELLPAGLTPNADSTAFLLQLDAFTLTRTLSQLCPACPPVTATAPKPAFNATVVDTIPLPADVKAVALAASAVTLQLTNGFSFDPIRPSATARGTIGIELTDGTRTIASDVVDGTSQAFPAGSTMTRSLTLAPGAVSGDVAVVVTIDSPAGDATQLDPNDSFTLFVPTTNVNVTEATIVASGIDVQSDPVNVNFAQVDDVVVDHVQAATMFLEIDNPFRVAGPLRITIAPESAPAIQTSATLRSDSTSTETVEFTTEEIRSILAGNNVLTVDGNVTAVAGELTVTPRKAITVMTRLALTIGPNEETN